MSHFCKDKQIVCPAYVIPFTAEWLNWYTLPFMTGLQGLSYQVQTQTCLRQCSYDPSMVIHITTKKKL